MTSKELRQKFLDFMVSKGHAIIPSGSLVPKEDPTVLFINSGMQPLVPYLLGQTHPDGTRLANSQKCLRTADIEEVGDNRHGTFFEMLGFWSLGDYFKLEAISWTFEFLTSPDYLNLDPHRIYTTVYKGSSSVAEDEEAIKIWQQEFAKVGIQADVGDEYDFKNPENNSSDAKYTYRISRRSGKDNWWGLPYRGPCGPSSENYYLLDRNPVNFETTLFPSMNLGDIENFIENEVVEIGNNVFMTFEGEADENKVPYDLVPLAKKNIDTGLGFERLLMAVNHVDTVQETDTLRPIAAVAKKYAKL